MLPPKAVVKILDSQLRETHRVCTVRTCHSAKFVQSWSPAEFSWCVRNGGDGTTVHTGGLVVVLLAEEVKQFRCFSSHLGGPSLSDNRETSGLKLGIERSNVAAGNL